jgi:hypothetical protein
MLQESGIPVNMEIFKPEGEVEGGAECQKPSM